MPKRLTLVVVATALALAGGSAAASQRTAARAPLAKIPLYVPSPGHVTVEGAELHVSGGAAAGLPSHVRMKLVGGGVAPGAEAMLAWHVRKHGKTATVTVIATIVNGGSHTAARVNAPLRPADGPGLELLDYFVDPKSLPPEYLERQAFYRAHREEIFAAMNLDLGTKKQVAGATNALEKLFQDPSAITFDEPFDTGQYDDLHGFGWKFGQKQGVRDGLRLLNGPWNEVLLEKTFADAGLQPLPATFDDQLKLLLPAPTGGFFGFQPVPGAGTVTGDVTRLNMPAPLQTAYANDHFLFRHEGIGLANGVDPNTPPPDQVFLIDVALDLFPTPAGAADAKQASDQNLLGRGFVLLAGGPGSIFQLPASGAQPQTTVEDLLAGPLLVKIGAVCESCENGTVPSQLDDATRTMLRNPFWPGHY